MNTDVILIHFVLLKLLSNEYHTQGYSNIQILV